MNVRDSCEITLQRKPFDEGVKAVIEFITDGTGRGGG